MSVLICICVFHGTLPGAFVFSTIGFDRSPCQIASGTIADTYQGTNDGVKVCFKQLQAYSTPSYENDWLQRVRRSFFPLTYPLNRSPKAYQAAILWMYMEHPNIVPFLGVTTTPLRLVSKWIPGGNLMEYLKAHPDADPLGLVCPASACEETS